MTEDRDPILMKDDKDMKYNDMPIRYTVSSFQYLHNKYPKEYIAI